VSGLDALFLGGARLGDLDVPGPARVPVLGWRGNVLKFFADPFVGLDTLYRTHGRLVGLAAGHPAFVCAFGPEYNHPLLTDRVHFDQFVTPLPVPAGSALATLLRNPFTATGEEHARHRRVMVPPFHRKRIARYRDGIAARIDDALGPWRPGDRLDLADALRDLSLQIILRSIFDFGDAHSRETAARFRALVDAMLARMTSSAAVFFPVPVPGAPYHQLLRLAERFDHEARALIAAHRRAPRADVLSDLVDGHAAEGSADPDADLVGELFSLFTAGHLTVYASLAWTCLLLAAHPAVLGDLRDELRATLRGDTPQLEHLGGLVLLDRVIKESLRLLPTAPYASRIVKQPVEMSGRLFPVGSVVIYSSYVTHHLPELYRAPERFDPARWETLRPSPYAYLPFGTGPRTCVGADFALLEMKLVLATMLQRFWPEVTPGARVDARLGMVLLPDGALPVTLRPAGSRVPAARVRGNVHRAVTLPRG